MQEGETRERGRAVEGTRLAWKAERRAASGSWLSRFPWPVHGLRSRARLCESAVAVAGRPRSRHHTPRARRHARWSIYTTPPSSLSGRQRGAGQLKDAQRRPRTQQLQQSAWRGAGRGGGRLVVWLSHTATASLAVHGCLQASLSRRVYASTARRGRPARDLPQPATIGARPHPATASHRHAG